MGSCESSAEVAGRGGIRDSACPEGIEECYVAASEFDVLKARAVAQWVVGDVEDMVGFVVRQMDFEQVKSFVDGLRQTDLMGERVDGRDASVSDGPVSVRNVVFYGAAEEDGPGYGGAVCFVESSLDSGLAWAEVGTEDGPHSKSLVGSGGVGCVYIHKPQKPLRVSSFLGIAATGQAEITLGLGLTAGCD